MPTLVVDNTIASAMSEDFFVGKEPKTEMSRVAHSRRKDLIEDVLKVARRIKDPSNAVPHDIATMLAVMILLGVSQSDLAKRLQISKTTISRWLNEEAPPRPIAREIIVARSKAILEGLLQDAKEKAA